MADNILVFYGSYRSDRMGIRLADFIVRGLAERGAEVELIAAKGTAGFTFAEAARFAGVSPAAPYRHFRDRDELIEE